MSSGSDEGGGAAALHLVRALAAISNVRIAPCDSVNELLCSIVAKRIQNFTGFPEDDGSGGALHPNSRISSESSRLQKGHILIGPKISADPYLDKLISHARSYGPVSVRRNEQTVQTIHRGDVVVHEEHGVENKVMGAVLGFKTARTRTDTCIVHVQVQRLYSFHELLGIVNRLQHYR